MFGVHIETLGIHEEIGTDCIFNVDLNSPI
jgi:hypothetical protein